MRILVKIAVAGLFGAFCAAQANAANVPFDVNLTLVEGAVGTGQVFVEDTGLRFFTGGSVTFDGTSGSLFNAPTTFDVLLRGSNVSLDLLRLGSDINSDLTGLTGLRLSTNGFQASELIDGSEFIPLSNFGSVFTCRDSVCNGKISLVTSSISEGTISQISNVPLPEPAWMLLAALSTGFLFRRMARWQ